MQDNHKDEEEEILQIDSESLSFVPTDLTKLMGTWTGTFRIRYRKSKLPKQRLRTIDKLMKENNIPKFEKRICMLSMARLRRNKNNC